MLRNPTARAILFVRTALWLLDFQSPQHYIVDPPHGTWTEKIIFAFGLRTNDGILPYSNLILDTAGNLYGTTSFGGSRALCYIYGNTLAGCGTVFELECLGSDRWAQKILHNFGAGIDGEAPYAGLVFDTLGNLYGTTTTGGPPYGCGGSGKSRSCGVVFELMPEGNKGWDEKFLPLGGYDFSSGLTIDSGGNVYGTSVSGGECGNDYASHCGTAFELSPQAGAAWQLQSIYEFQGGFTAGTAPSSGLIFDTNGNLYGTTSRGENDSIGTGTVYQLSPTISGQWTETTLYNFSGRTDGGLPSGNLVIDASGNLYGTTQAGGAYGKDILYKITP